MSLSSSDLSGVSIPSRIRRNYFKAFLRRKRFGSVLECGCGVGVYSVFLRAIAEKLTCFDIVPELVDNAMQYAPGPEYCVADILNMPFGEESFDLVIVADVIEHTSNPEKTISEIVRVLKRNGLAVLSVPSERLDFVCRLCFSSQEEVGHHFHFREETILALLEEAGLCIVKHRYIQGVVSSLYEVLLAKWAGKLYGKDNVGSAQASTLTAKNVLKSYCYYFFNIIMYPVIVFLDALFIRKVEHLIVARKVPQTFKGTNM